MIRRRLLIGLLAVVATGIAIPAVWWTVLHWHVVQVGEDRARLFVCLEAPTGSWDWTVIEAYSQTHHGKEALRRELATVLCEFSWYGRDLDFEETGVPWKHELRFPLLNVSGGAQHAVVVADGYVHTLSGKASRRRAMSDRDELLIDRLNHLVEPSARPVAELCDSALYVVRLVDSIVPPEADPEDFTAAQPFAVLVSQRKLEGKPECDPSIPD